MSHLSIERLAALADESNGEILVESAYFVPEKRTFARMEQRVADGVAVCTLTNSLAATNHLTVHAGYVRHRKDLLRSGVRMHELKPAQGAARRFGFTYEGMFRQAIVYKGRNRDTTWFAIIDGDWRGGLEQAYLRWLEPANFSADGRQKLRLSELTAPFVERDVRRLAGRQHGFCLLEREIERQAGARALVDRGGDRTRRLGGVFATARAAQAGDFAGGADRGDAELRDHR